jgi:hypothetical protein
LFLLNDIISIHFVGSHVLLFFHSDTTTVQIQYMPNFLQILVQLYWDYQRVVSGYLILKHSSS